MNLRNIQFTMQSYSDTELLELVHLQESDRVEFKESFQKNVKEKVCQTVCAFANDLPNHNKAGVIFIGIKDDGSFSNIKIDDELLQNLTSVKSDGNILAPPTILVEKRNLNKNKIAVITVFPSDTPPVRYKGCIYVRIGPSVSVATEQEENRLSEKRKSKNIPFDLFPVGHATIDDLSRTIFENDYLPQAFAPSILEDNSRDYEQRLAACKMIVSVEDTTPTVVGLLTLGKNIQDFLPSAYVQFLRIDGKELSDPVLDEETIGGTIVDQLRKSEEKISAHNKRAIDILSEPTDIKTISYPNAAYQQILYNAILHSTYQNTNAPTRIYWFNDRIEIHSVGGPFGIVTEKTLDYLALLIIAIPILQMFSRLLAISKNLEGVLLLLKKS